MSDDTQRVIGAHDEAIETLKNELQAMRAELTQIRVLLAETKGGVRMLIAVGSVGGAIGAALVKGISYVKGLV